MKYMQTGGFERHPLMRLTLWFTLLFLAGFLAINFSMYFSRMGLSPDSVANYYLGSEADFTPPRTLGSMLETAHMHLPVMALVLLLLTHLMIFAPFSESTKYVFISAAFAAALMHEGSGWLVRFVHPDFAVFKIAGFLALQGMMGFLIVGLGRFLYQASSRQKRVSQDRSKTLGPEGESPLGTGEAEKSVFLVGSPNVGKSSIFNALTGSYVVVSNYPGTTVGISRGSMKIGEHHRVNVVDTPGMYSLRPITGEESVGRKLLLDGKPDAVLHVVDAKNLERMLPLTLQLKETGLPVILVLNLYDEMQARGIELDVAHFEHDLGIPVVETVAVSGMGVENLKARIVEVLEGRYKFNGTEPRFSEDLEERIAGLSGLLKREYGVSHRTIASLLLQNDAEILGMVAGEASIDEIKKLAGNGSGQETGYRFSEQRQGHARGIVGEHRKVDDEKRDGGWKERLSRLMVHPIWGVPILAAVLWFGLYKFVGEFGAGTMVDFIEANIFAAYINPQADALFHFLFGQSIWFDLFGGDYGIVTLGVRYAVAIVLPVVATFFLVFSIIEDTGYLPRLAMLVDKIFKAIGLSGRAVIPITLGFGCDTMATIVTRTLESTKERVIATMLLSLAIPCSAQLGVLLGLLADKPMMLAVWAGAVGLVFLLTGFLAKQLVPGQDTEFFMEMPPLRLPQAWNVFTKTYSRMVWYFKEVLPIFIFASVMIWFGKLTGIFDVLLKLMSYPVVWAGMPEGAAPAFLYGFFRRDFGAAGLFDLAKDGVLAGNSLVVAAVVLTLFIPCVAQFAVTWKERGKGMALGMAAFIFPFSFIAGYILDGLLNLFGVSL